MIGQGVADVGACERLQPGASAAGRAIASLDYARLLERYLAQHGALLAEPFIEQLPLDDLQASAEPQPPGG
jgi:hypothetical protein